MSQKAVLNWLKARAKIATDLHERGLLHRTEQFKAEADAAFEGFSSPLRLRDGTTLPDSKVWEKRYNSK